MLIALARLSGWRALRWLAFSYVSVFRGTPLLIQMLLIYFGLPSVGIVIDPIPAALLALSLFAAAYLSENFRAGIMAVDRGQWEAAQSMGMSYPRTLSRVILPQAIRIAIPDLGSRLIGLMKDTSLASTVTVVELTRVADQIGATTFRYMDMFLIVGAIYWLINQSLTIPQAMLEHRLAKRYQ
jgi:cystine transport system permease protein